MRKTLILLMICAGCTEINEPHKPEITNIVIDGRLCRVLIIDGCEYIVLGVDHSQMMSHKGNCQNPIHKYNIGDTLR